MSWNGAQDIIAYLAFWVNDGADNMGASMSGALASDYCGFRQDQLSQPGIA